MNGKSRLKMQIIYLNKKNDTYKISKHVIYKQYINKVKQFKENYFDLPTK